MLCLQKLQYPIVVEACDRPMYQACSSVGGGPIGALMLLPVYYPARRRGGSLNLNEIQCMLQVHVNVSQRGTNGRVLFGIKRFVLDACKTTLQHNTRQVLVYRH